MKGGIKVKKISISIDIDIDKYLTKYCNDKLINKSKLISKLIKEFLNTEI